MLRLSFCGPPFFRPYLILLCLSFFYWSLFFWSVNSNGNKNPAESQRRKPQSTFSSCLTSLTRHSGTLYPLPFYILLVSVCLIPLVSPLRHLVPVLCYSSSFRLFSLSILSSHTHTHILLSPFLFQLTLIVSCSTVLSVIFFSVLHALHHLLAPSGVPHFYILPPLYHILPAGSRSLVRNIFVFKRS